MLVAQSGRAYNSPNSKSYLRQAVAPNSRVGILFDKENGKIEFTLNGVRKGIAF